MLTSIWKIPQDKILIVVNRCKKESLSLRQVSSILDGYEIVLKVDEDLKLEGIINGMGEFGMNNVDKVDKVAEVLGLIVDNKESEAGDIYDN